MQKGIGKPFLAIWALTFLIMLLPVLSESAGQSRAQLTILYDNYPGKEGLMAEDGFSCLIRGNPKTILFDTGGKGDVLLSNMDKLGIRPDIIDIVVISHEHKDHTGGLLSLLQLNPEVTVFLPGGFSDYDLMQKISTYGTRTVSVEKPVEICSGVWSTGPMQGSGLSEQSLVLNSKSGLILICGCAHPGIINIIEASKRIFKKPIIFVFGGFHIMSESESVVFEFISKFVSNGVIGVGGSHCTGETMRRSLKTYYGKTYVEMGVGATISLR